MVDGGAHWVELRPGWSDQTVLTSCPPADFILRSVSCFPWIFIRIAATLVLRLSGRVLFLFVFYINHRPFFIENCIA